MASLQKTTGRTALQVQAIAQKIPQYIAGTEPDEFGIGSAYWAGFAYWLFTLAARAYEAKSKGGTDDLGNDWPPLAASTVEKILREMMPPGEKGLLTSAEIAKWRKAYSETLAVKLRSSSREDAESQAAKIAWTSLKLKGAKTYRELAKYLHPLIMIRSGRLFNSVKPGTLTATTYNPPPEQHAGMDARGKHSYGSSVPYSKWTKEQRSIFPKNHRQWVNEAHSFAMNHAAQQFTNII